MVSSVVTAKKRISVYINEELKERLEKLAKSRKRSLNNLIETCMEEIADKAEEDGELK